MITKEKFLTAYNKHLPNKFIKFMYWLNRGNDATVDTPKNRIIYTLLALFLVGFIGTVFDFSHTFILIPTVILGLIIVPVVGASFIASFMNNARIKRIMKELDIKSTQKYNELVNMYYEK